MLNLIDRNLMGILLDPIKHDLRLSDTQLGFVTGIAFALFYAVAGIPLARWADRSDRANLAASAIGLWGLTVMACLFVGNYAQLVCARIAAAVGEAGCKPPTYSLVGDYFPEPQERTRAMSVYWLGSPLATLIAFLIGGWLNEHFGWRATFFIMGVPGLLLAVLVKATLIEPRRKAVVVDAGKPSFPPIRDVFARLWRQRSSRHLILALILFYVLGFGMGPWYASFLIRSHGMQTSEVGVSLGLIQGIGGIIGILVGGVVASRWFAGDEAGQMRVTAVMVAALMPLLMMFLFAPQRDYALLIHIPFIVVLNFFFAPTYSLLQRLVADDVRATTLAIVSMLAHLIGMGVGPQLVGIISDCLTPALGGESLRFAMLLVSLTAFWSSFNFWRVGRTVREDLERIEQINRSRFSATAAQPLTGMSNE